MTTPKQISPAIHELLNALAYKQILDECRAVLGLKDGDSLVDAIKALVKPSAVTDEQIEAVFLACDSEDKGRFAIVREFARAILALRPVPMTGEVEMIGDSIFAGIFEEDIREVKFAAVLKFSSFDEMVAWHRAHNAITSARKGGE